LTPVCFPSRPWLLGHRKNQPAAPVSPLSSGKTSGCHWGFPLPHGSISPCGARLSNFSLQIFKFRSTILPSPFPNAHVGYRFLSSPAAVFAGSVPLLLALLADLLLSSFPYSPRQQSFLGPPSAALFLSFSFLYNRDPPYFFCLAPFAVPQTGLWFTFPFGKNRSKHPPLLFRCQVF